MKKKHGGKRLGAGRKPKPETDRRDKVFSIKLTEDEKKLLEEVDARNWARETLLASAKRRKQSGR